ncbi:MAG: CoA-binding protein [Candidatus Aenigmatarchaeota archaeon]
MFESLEGFFNPKSVAVIGASHTHGKIGRIVFENFIHGGFRGRVYPINPNPVPIDGIGVYPSVKKLPEKVDLAVIATPAKTVPGLLKECAEAGIKSVIVISSGFSEIGKAGKQLEDECREIIEKRKMIVMGPNCLGVYDSASRVDTLFLTRSRLGRPKDGGITFISQSGAVGATMLDWLSDQGIGISKFVSYGNGIGINESDLLEHLADDARTKVIVSYIEGLKSDGRRFMEAAKKASKKKPVIILKGGKTGMGTAAAASHTGSIAGSSKVYSAAFKQSGAIEAAEWTELFDIARAFASQPLPAGNRLLIVTDGGGFGVLAADEAERRKLQLKPPSERMARTLKSAMPSYVSLQNPIDLTGDATTERFELAIEEGLKEYDGVVAITIFQVPLLDKRIASAIPAMAGRHGKPVLCCAAGGEFTKTIIRELEERGVPVYQTPERAVRVFDAMLEYASSRQ